MKRILSEKNIAAMLFVTALVVFALAQQDARKMEEKYKQSRAVVLPDPVEQQVTQNNSGGSPSTPPLSE